MRRKEATHQRILDAASELFYRRGIQPTGVEQLVDRAGVSKPTLYKHFDSKEQVVETVVRRWDEERRAELQRIFDDTRRRPDQRILAVFDWLRDWFAQDSFRGCALVNAHGELRGEDHAANAVIARHKLWVRDQLATLCRAAKLQRPGAVAEQLLLLMEGATAMAAIREVPREVYLAARKGAQTILDAARRPAGARS